jgi:hypothetical protein
MALILWYIIIKDYLKDSYNIKKFIEINIDDEIILATLKNNSYF